MLSLEDQIVVALRRTSHAIDVWSRQLLQQYGLTSPQLATLREIEAGQNVTNGALAIALHLSQPTVTGILNRLEQRLIAPSAPNRIAAPSLPPSLQREVGWRPTRPPCCRDRFCQQLVMLSEEERQRILAVLQQVAEMMHAPQIGEEPFLFHA